MQLVTLREAYDFARHVHQRQLNKVACIEGDFHLFVVLAPVVNLHPALVACGHFRRSLASLHNPRLRTAGTFPWCALLSPRRVAAASAFLGEGDDGQPF